MSCSICPLFVLKIYLGPDFILFEIVERSIVKVVIFEQFLEIIIGGFVGKVGDI